MLRLGALLLGLALGACDDPAGMTADMPLHLEDHLDAAVIEGSEVPVNPPASIEWRFDEPQPEWKPAQPTDRISEPARLERTADALRVTATERGERQPNGVLNPLIYVDLPDWRREDWAEVVVRARTTTVTQMAVGLGTWEGGSVPPATRRTLSGGGSTPVVSDGTVQTYRIRPEWRGAGSVGSWRRLGLGFFMREPGSIDVLSVSVVPIGSLYADAPAGVRSVSVGDHLLRRTLYAHAPGSVSYAFRVPEGGRLGLAMGVLSNDVPLEFRILAEPPGGEATTLLRETYTKELDWGERSVDLARFAGETITLTLESDAAEPGAVAFWGAPTVSGVRGTDKPNVVFYIIDGGSADYMSLYGYNRRTTPNLERIAAEGAVFERAYSNSSRTTPSTASFLTSLHHSVLGGVRAGRNPLPSEVTTLAEHLHRAGYQTAELTSNANAGRVNGLERGHDVFRDVSFGDVANHSISSLSLHGDFWQWRTTYPGEPYYVHFQTTDVHSDHYPVPPFAGLFISPDRRRLLDTWYEGLDQAEASGVTRPELYERAGVSWVDLNVAERDLHDETMAHQDYQLGHLVARLKATGEWERTLLIVAADHGVHAGASDYELRMRGLQQLESDERTADDGGHAAAMFASGVSHIPLVVVWPGRIAPGQRFSDPVSMIDMLPTILDLADLPLPDVMQGQSLASLLLGEEGWEPRPVILDEFNAGARTGALRGRIEVIDGRWGASLQINPRESDNWGDVRWGGIRPVPLLLYDLWTDPMCLHSLHEEHPDLVEKYTKFLEEQFEAHLALGRHLTPSEASPLTPEQLETLRSLGYIR